MKFTNSRAAQAATAANPAPEALGFDLEQALADAARSALKPLAKRLGEYSNEVRRLERACARWTDEAFDAKIEEIANAAHSGDESAASAIENGTIPTAESYRAMHGRAIADLEGYRSNAARIFAEAAELVAPALDAVVDRAQAVLDGVLADFGVPRHLLHGPRNHVQFIVHQLRTAGRGESADLSWFWQAVEG